MCVVFFHSTHKYKYTCVHSRNAHHVIFAIDVNSMISRRGYVTTQISPTLCYIILYGRLALCSSKQARINIIHNHSIIPAGSISQVDHIAVLRRTCSRKSLKLYIILVCIARPRGLANLIPIFIVCISCGWPRVFQSRSAQQCNLSLSVEGIITH